MKRRRWRKVGGRAARSGSEEGIESGGRGGIWREECEGGGESV